MGEKQTVKFIDLLWRDALMTPSFIRPFRLGRRRTSFQKFCLQLYCKKVHPEGLVRVSSFAGFERQRSREKPNLKAVFVACPTKQASMAKGLFYGGSRCRAVAHTHPAVSKNALGPVGIPLFRAPQASPQAFISRRR